MKVTRATIIKANQELIRNNGKAKELTLLEKYALSIVDGTADTFEHQDVIQEFDKLDFQTKEHLMISAKLRYFLQDLIKNHPEKIQEAYREAVDNILKSKIEAFKKEFPISDTKSDSNLKFRILNILKKVQNFLNKSNT